MIAFYTKKKKKKKKIDEYFWYVKHEFHPMLFSDTCWYTTYPSSMNDKTAIISSGRVGDHWRVFWTLGSKLKAKPLK
jgi:hypothetical protein